jgi:hypothetical protein
VPVNVRLTATGFSADGKAIVRQTDFGIQPVTAGAGTVRVKDEIDVTFSVSATAIYKRATLSAATTRASLKGTRRSRAPVAS